MRWSVVRKLPRGDIQVGRFPLNKQATGFLLKAALGDQILKTIAYQAGQGAHVPSETDFRFLLKWGWQTKDSTGTQVQIQTKMELRGT